MHQRYRCGAIVKSIGTARIVGQVNGRIPSPITQIARIAQKLAKAGDRRGKLQITVVPDIVSGDRYLDALTLVGSWLFIAQRDKSDFSGNGGVSPFAVAQW